MARRNTSTQEAFISSLNTRGALDEGSGFDANYGKGETNEQFEARLKAWQNKGTGEAPPTTAPSPSVTAINAVAGSGGTSASGGNVEAGGAPVDMGMGTGSGMSLASIQKILGRRSFPSLSRQLGPQPY